MSTESGPLTFGQLSTLRHLQKIPAERWIEGNMIYRHKIIDGSASLDLVVSALKTMARHHAALRTTYDLTDFDHPVQFVHDDVVLNSVVAGPADAAEAMRVAPLVNFDFATDRGWQTTVILDAQGRPTDLILVVSHLIVDGWSCHHLNLDLGPLIGERDPGRDHSVVSLRKSTELAALQRGDEWADRRNRAEVYWRDFFTRSSAELLAKQGVGAPVERVSHGSLLLTQQQAMLSAISRRGRVFTGGILLGLLGLALLQKSDEEVLPFALMTANRNIPVWQDLASSFNQQIPVLLRRPAPDEKALAYLSEAQRISLGAHQNGCYDVDMADRIAAEVTSSVPKSYGPMLSFIAAGGDGGAKADGPQQPVTVGPSPHAIPYDLFIEVNEGSGAVNMYAVDTVLSADEVRACLQWICDSIPMLAERDDVRVGDLPTLTWPTR